MPLDPITHVTDTRPWFGNIPIESLYTVGIAGEQFFREIKDRARLVGTYCSDCDITYVPPRLYCERCFAQLDDWVEVGTHGWVYTYTLLHTALDGSRLEEPEIVAFVQLDGADGGLIHRLGEVDPDQVEIGMQVEAVFKEKAERTGSILDIEYFRPL
jgi:uncharacterized OB-fold protein